MPRLKWKKGWKVIRIDHQQNRVSCVTNGSVVKYLKNKITNRPVTCGPLAVFKTRQAARDFVAKWFWSRKIVKCLYTESKDVSLWCPRASWVGGTKNRHDLPKGTLLAEKVKCLE